MSKKPTVDGFIPRRSSTPNEGFISNSVNKRPVPPRRSELGAPTRPFTPNRTNVSPVDTHSHGALRRSDVDESLRQIDESSKHEVQGQHERGGYRSKRKKLMRRVVVAMVLFFMVVGGWVGIKALLASTAIFKGDIFGLVQQKKLKMDAQGRSNVLIFGTSEDDEGGAHPGALLTDSIMVLSIDQNKKDAYMVSVPRDLWVKYGQVCNAGYVGKINELFDCYSNGGTDQEAGARGLAKVVSEVTGLDIQYTTHLNYSVVRQAVDAVGGVDVKIESSDPRGILDRNFDWKCNYQCYYVKYKNGEVAHMDGEHALAFMRARNAQGGYGLAGGNFDREKNQQKVIIALREKALSAGTLANPGKVTGLIGALGDNLHTDFETPEVRTLIGLASDIQTSSIVSVNLVDDNEPVMTTGSVGDASVVRPVLGIFDYSGVKAYIRKSMNSDPIVKEGAKIAVLNGSGVVGAAQAAATKLEDMGFTIVSVGNAPDGTYERREVYQRDATAMPLTRTKLTSLYGPPKTGLTKFGVAETVDFVVIIGEASPSGN